MSMDKLIGLHDQTALKNLKKINASKGKLDGVFCFVCDAKLDNAALIVELRKKDPKNMKVMGLGKKLKTMITGAKTRLGFVQVNDANRLEFQLGKGNASPKLLSKAFKQILSKRKGLTFLKTAVFGSAGSQSNTNEEDASELAQVQQEVEVLSLKDKLLIASQLEMSEAEEKELLRITQEDPEVVLLLDNGTDRTERDRQNEVMMAAFDALDDDKVDDALRTQMEFIAHQLIEMRRNWDKGITDRSVKNVKREDKIRADLRANIEQLYESLRPENAIPIYRDAQKASEYLFLEFLKATDEYIKASAASKAKKQAYKAKEIEKMSDGERELHYQRVREEHAKLARESTGERGYQLDKQMIEDAIRAREERHNSLNKSRDAIKVFNFEDVEALTDVSQLDAQVNLFDALKQANFWSGSAENTVNFKNDIADSGEYQAGLASGFMMRDLQLHLDAKNQLRGEGHDASNPTLYNQKAHGAEENFKEAWGPSSADYAKTATDGMIAAASYGLEHSPRATSSVQTKDEIPEIIRSANEMGKSLREMAQMQAQYAKLQKNSPGLNQSPEQKAMNQASADLRMRLSKQILQGAIDYQEGAENLDFIGVVKVGPSNAETSTDWNKGATDVEKDSDGRGKLIQEHVELFDKDDLNIGGRKDAHMWDPRPDVDDELMSQLFDDAGTFIGTSLFTNKGWPIEGSPLAMTELGNMSLEKLEKLSKDEAKALAERHKQVRADRKDFADRQAERSQEGTKQMAKGSENTMDALYQMSLLDDFMKRYKDQAPPKIPPSLEAGYTLGTMPAVPRPNKLKVLPQAFVVQPLPTM